MTGPSPSPFTSVRHARRRRGASILRIVVGALVLAMVLAIVSAGAVWAYGAYRLEATSVGTPLTPRGAAGPEGLTTTLVSVVEGQRSTDLLLIQTGVREAPLVVSLPLDLQVRPEGGPEVPLAAVRKQAPDAGLATLVATVAGYGDLAIDHAVELDPWALVRTLDLQDEVPLPEPGAPTDDRFERVVALTDGARALGTQLSATSQVANPFRARHVIDAVAEHVRTDVDPGPLGLRRLAEDLSAHPEVDPDIRTVPAFHDPTTGVTHPYWEQAQTLFQALRLGEPVPDGLGAEDPHDDELAPAKVRVEVLNAIGTAGLAGSVADRLTAAGFSVTSTGNAEPFDPAATTTRVAHGPDGELHAGLVAELLGDVTLEERPGLDRDQVVVYAGADQVDR